MVKTLGPEMANYSSVVLETCAYAGTGDVLKIQQMLATAGEHIESGEDQPWKVRMSEARRFSCVQTIAPSLQKYTLDSVTSQHC